MGPPKSEMEIKTKVMSRSSTSKPLPSVPASIAASSSRSLSKRPEVTHMNRIIKEDRAEKGRAIIAVVKADDLQELERKSKNSKWKFWQGKSIVRVTTPEKLQDVINSMHLNEKEKNCRHLTLLVTKELEEITFNVGSIIQTLSVFRHDSDPSPAGSLLINGSAMFSGVRLDEWQARKHKKHAIYLGQGVGIKIEDLSAVTAPSTPPSQTITMIDNENSTTTSSAVAKKTARAPARVWGTYTLTLSNSEKGEVYELFNSLYQNNNNNNPDLPWWERWQGPISTILGILTGSKPVNSLRATAGGFYVEYQFGAALMTLGGVGFQTAVTSAAGPAAMLGLGAASAVYFIPWNAVFKWFWEVFKSLYRQFLSLWEKLMRWLSDKIKGSGGSDKGGQPPMPMEFQ